MKIIRPLLTAALLLFAGAGLAAATQPDDAHSIATEVSARDITVKVIGGMLEIDNATDTEVEVTVYAITGRVVKTFQAHPGQTDVDLAAGYYIVKAGRYSAKVAVK